MLADLYEGDLLRQRLERALREALEQAAIFTEFTEAIEQEDAGKLSQWRSHVLLWESADKDDKTPCPYYVNKRSKCNFTGSELSKAYGPQ